MAAKTATTTVPAKGRAERAGWRCCWRFMVLLSWKEGRTAMVPSKPQWLLSPNFSKARPERLSDNGDTSRGCPGVVREWGLLRAAAGTMWCFAVLRMAHEHACANGYSTASLCAWLSARVPLDGTHRLNARVRSCIRGSHLHAHAGRQPDHRQIACFHCPEQLLQRCAVKRRMQGFQHREGASLRRRHGGGLSSKARWCCAPLQQFSEVSPPRAAVVVSIFEQQHSQELKSV